VFIVSQPDYESENIDSVWLSESDALARAAVLGSAFISEYRLNAAAAWVRNGWYHPDGPICWSDWGFVEKDAQGRA
jgi:hypothetical protein